MNRALALAVVLGATAAGGQPAADAPVREPSPLDSEGRRFAIPAVEGVAFNFGLLAFTNLVTRMPFGQVSAQSVASHLPLSAWTLDVDYYLTNQFGHPYQGALQFAAARSVGLSFWWSTLYAALGSLAWELCFEIDRPSVNDQITTTLGGALLGEALHRSALELRGDGHDWLRVLGALLVDPGGGINDALFDEAPSPPEVLSFIRLEAGASAGTVVDRSDGRVLDRTPAQGLVALRLTSGVPWNPRARFDQPFSFFELRGDLSFPSRVVGNIFIRGLLVGRRFGDPAGDTSGVWGLFGDYDYAAPAIMRASAVGLGPSVTLQHRLSGQLYLQFSGLLGVSPFSAAGQLLDVSPDLGRDYHVGPGLQAMADLSLIHAQWFQLELLARNWLVFGVYTPPSGFESITTVTLGLTVAIWHGLGAGAELGLADRRAAFEGATARDTGASLRLTLSAMTDARFDVAP